MIRFRPTTTIGLTYILIALNVLIYACASVLSGNFLTMDYYRVLQIYGQFNLRVFEGWWWQLFTAMFVHVNILHIFGNMLFLLIFGLRAEELFRVKYYLIIYLAGGLVGNVLTLLFGPFMVSAGASGAILSLYGAVIVYIRRAVGQSITGALVYAFFLLFITSGMGVNILAHLGGLVFGLLAGYLLATVHRKKPVEYEYVVRYSA